MYAFIQSSLIQQILTSVLYLASFWLSSSDRSISKQSAYECGLEPMGDARIKFQIIYYLIGILYLIFDQEVIFQFPLATILYNLNSQFALWTAIIFQIIQTIGFIYEWYLGALKINPTSFQGHNTQNT